MQTSSELPGPAMYMLWPAGLPAPEVRSLPPAYRLCVLAGAQFDQARPIIESDGALSHSEWRRYCNSLVPGGLFVVIECASSQWVGSIGAAHNPAAARFYFPGGGQLSYLVVAPDHRCRGLGSALVASAVRRLRRGGFGNIFVAVEPRRIPAIRTYLRAGFQPFIHASGLAERWRTVFAALGREPREPEWLTALPDSGGPA